MFQNRIHAGSLLAQRLSLQKGGFDVVLAVPRGGVVIGSRISEILNLPLRALVVKKVPTPGQTELAKGAIGPGGIFAGEKSKEVQKVVEENIKKFGSPGNVRGKSVILTDDGIATGRTIETAIRYLRDKGVDRVTLAIPVAPKDVINRLRGSVYKIFVLETPGDFRSVGEFYGEFPQVTDEEVLQLLQK